MNTIAVMRIYIESLGCAKNQVDSEILLTYALENGYERTENAEDADVIVVNTCGFIESAKEESINTFFSLHELNPKARIIMAGCLAERYGRDMDLKEADAIFGNKDLSLFPEVLNGKGKLLIPSEPNESAERDDRKVLLGYPGSAYLKISEGCNHRCSYCAIPVIRGDLRSRPMDKVLAEAKRLIENGVYEINVVAQDLGAYGTDHGGPSRFVELMDKLSSLEGNFVLRMLYIHPDTFPKGLIELAAERKKILPYFDIPFQHADEKVLRLMKRTGNREKYLALLERIRKALPDAVIRTTIMLGFPEEDRKAFDEVKRFVEEARFDWMGSFLYSREEDTPAFDMRGEEEHEKAQAKAKRWQKELEKIQERITSENLNRFVGHEYTALVEDRIEGEDLAIGRIYSEAPDVDGLTVIMGRGMKSGDVVRVGITRVRGIDLEGVKID